MELRHVSTAPEVSGTLDQNSGVLSCSEDLVCPAQPSASIRQPFVTSSLTSSGGYHWHGVG